MKNKRTAFLLTLLGFVGVAGMQHFYLDNWLITIGLFSAGTGYFVRIIQEQNMWGGKAPGVDELAGKVTHRRERGKAEVQAKRKQSTLEKRRKTKENKEEKTISQTKEKNKRMAKKIGRPKKKALMYCDLCSTHVTEKCSNRKYCCTWWMRWFWLE